MQDKKKIKIFLLNHIPNILLIEITSSVLYHRESYFCIISATLNVMISMGMEIEGSTKQS